MSIAYTGIPRRHDTILLLDDNDPVDAVHQVSPGFAQLKDEIAFALGAASSITVQQGTGGTGTFAAVPVAMLNVSGMAVTTVQAQVGDRLVCLAQCNLVAATGSASPTQMRLRVFSASQSVVAVPCAQVLASPTANGVPILFFGIVSASFAEVYTFQLQATLNSANAVNITNDWMLSTVLFRSP